MTVCLFRSLLMRPVEAGGLQHYPPNDEANGAKKRPELCPALPLLAAVPGGGGWAGEGSASTG